MRCGVHNGAVRETDTEWVFHIPLAKPVTSKKGAVRLMLNAGQVDKVRKFVVETLVAFAGVRGSTVTTLKQVRTSIYCACVICMHML